MNKSKKFVLTRSIRDWPEGTIVYPLKKHDYGCANDDRRILGVECESMSKTPDGDYPFSVIPLNAMAILNE